MTIFGYTIVKRSHIQNLNSEIFNQSLEINRQEDCINRFKQFFDWDKNSLTNPATYTVVDGSRPYADIGVVFKHMAIRKRKLYEKNQKKLNKKKK